MLQQRLQLLLHFKGSLKLPFFRKVLVREYLKIEQYWDLHFLKEKVYLYNLKISFLY